MNDFNNTNYNNYDQETQTGGINSYLSKVFGWMFAGLALSFATAYLTAHSRTILALLFSNPIMPLLLMIGELFLVFYLTRNITKLSQGAASGLFIIYSLLNGLTLSSIFIIYQIGTISSAFLVGAILFGVMAIYGKITKRDLSPFRSFLMMGLFGIFIAMIINMFVKSVAFDFVISGIGVFVFAGLTAWDIQKIKSYYYSYGDSEIAGNIAVLGALQLYLDFINIFLFLLRLFERRD